MSYEELKLLVVTATGLSRDALHLYAAVLAQILGALLFRRTLAQWLPWLCALAVTIGEEIVENAARDFELRDILAPMLLPTLLMLLTRFVPTLPRRRKREISRSERASAPRGEAARDPAP